MHGEGCANVAGCLEKVLAIGYAGPLSIEHEPYDRDPTDECARMLARIREQLAAMEVEHRV
jgi:L-ribulose-5-phosphate 3-epimerase